jgi:hypothetical protein
VAPDLAILAPAPHLLRLLLASAADATTAPLALAIPASTTATAPALTALALYTVSDCLSRLLLPPRAKNDDNLMNFPPPRTLLTSVSRTPVAADVSLHNSNNTFPLPLPQPLPLSRGTIRLRAQAVTITSVPAVACMPIPRRCPS